MEIVFIILIVVAVVFFVWMSTKANKESDPRKAPPQKPKDL
jgi:hypothetical protein